MSKKNAIIIFLVAIIVVSGGYFGYEYITQDKKVEQKEEKNTKKKEVVEYQDEVSHLTKGYTWGSDTEQDKQILAIENGKLTYTGSSKGKTYNYKVSGIAGTAKYFNYLRDCGGMVYIMVITEEGKAYYAPGDVANGIEISDVASFELEFKEVKSSDKIVDLGIKQALAARSMCLPERFFVKTDKGAILDVEMDDNDKMHTTSYDFRDYIGNSSYAFYVYKDKSIKVESYDEDSEEDKKIIDTFIVDSNNQKIAMKSIYLVSETGVKGMKKDKYAGYDINKATLYIISSEDKLYSLNVPEIKGNKVVVTPVNDKTVKSYNGVKMGYDAASWYSISDTNDAKDLKETITFTDNTTLDLNYITESYVFVR